MKRFSPDVRRSAKRILVTGGAGFLGSHLCAALSAQGLEVLNVDNFFTGRRSNLHALLDWAAQGAAEIG